MFYAIVQLNRPFNKLIIVTDFKVECFITSASECYFEAKNKKLGIGGKGYSFETEASVKGCYAYNSGNYNGLAFFGSKGPIKNMALKPTYTGSYPIYKPCLKAGEIRLFF